MPRSTDGWRARHSEIGGGGRAAGREETAAREPIPLTGLTDHVVLVGHGRVGGFISAALPAGTALLVIEDDAAPRRRAQGRGQGGDRRQCRPSRGDPGGESSRPRAASWWRSPTPSRAARWWRRRAELNPALPIIARAHSEDEIEHLKKHGATSVVMGEHEIAKAMIADIPPKRG